MPYERDRFHGIWLFFEGALEKKKFFQVVDRLSGAHSHFVSSYYLLTFFFLFLCRWTGGERQDKRKTERVRVSDEGEVGEKVEQRKEKLKRDTRMELRVNKQGWVFSYFCFTFYFSSPPCAPANCELLEKRKKKKWYERWTAQNYTLEIGNIQYKRGETRLKRRSTLLNDFPQIILSTGGKRKRSFEIEVTNHQSDHCDSIGEPQQVKK